ncbi:hypothetical protein M413DRAFT_30752 [Hebeloma cylindrosporum]|uniref:Uncharacterized protein n=1 Tax=Hebeloma cylindrosporum TaxID=76867 RepID=A0A0C3C1G8_HEBCY|nr:hypothetical protein M413DRAFT_30752 [Hebeloma cylindrosporum h7]
MPVKLTLDNTIGAAFLGLSHPSLTGISLVQAHLYYNFYTKDWIFQKVAFNRNDFLTLSLAQIKVGVLITLVVLHLIFVLHAVHYYLISNFGNMAALQNTVIWSFKLQVLMNAFMILFVQALYASRIWKLGRHFSHVWPIIVGLIVAGGWGIGFAMIVRTFEGKSFGDLHLMSDIIYATYCAATTIDVAIACTMCYYLYRSRSSFARTNSKIVTVMRYILITGCLTR